MNHALRQAFEAEMDDARDAYRRGRMGKAMRHAEIAHVLGQRHVVPHARTHWLMLKIGLRQRALSEVWGQALRIVLGIVGSAVGVVPTGNTGGTDIGMFKRLPIDPALKEILER